MVVTRVALTIVLVGLAIALLVAPAASASASGSLAVSAGAVALAHARPSLQGDLPRMSVLRRELPLRLHRLPPRQGTVSVSGLPRPDEGVADPFGTGYRAPARFTCSEHACVHWVETTADAPPPADANHNGIPDQVEATLATVEQAWALFVDDMGFRPPLSDLSSPDHGPDGRLDVYLADIGDYYYGYTATDDPRMEPTSGYPYYDVSAFIVLDNDYSPSQFGTANSPRQLLEVSVAHEFFHTIEFAYDIGEDVWMLESLATAFEGVAYPSVHDNYFYLAAGQLQRPYVPLDIFDPFSAEVYGNWVLWQYLGDHFGGLPALARRVLDLADGAPGALDDYSTQALDAALRGQGTTFRAAYAGFAAANAAPAAFYAEGRAYGAGPPADAHTLTPGKPGTGPRVAYLDHLTSRYVELIPGSGVPEQSQLSVTLHFPTGGSAAAASLVIEPLGGRARIVPVALDRSGNAVVRTRIGGTRKVVLVLTDTSTSTTCWVDDYGITYACLGLPLGDGLRVRYSANLVQGA